MEGLERGLRLPESTAFARIALSEESGLNPSPAPAALRCALLPFAERELHARVLAALAPEVQLELPGSLLELEALPADARSVLVHVDHWACEEIGSLGRILAVRPRWRLCCTGPDPSGRVARALLALPGARWLPWPLTLQEFHTLLAPQEPSSHAVPRSDGMTADHVETLGALVVRLEGAESALRDRAPGDEVALAALRDEVRRLGHFARTLALLAAPPERGADEFDLVALLDEQLATLTTGARTAERLSARTASGPRSPRFLVRADRPLLARAFETLLGLARRCAGPGGTVRVLYVPLEGERLEVRVEFPAGALAGLGAAGLADPRAVAARIPELWPADLAAAQAAIESQGGRLSLEARPEGLVRSAVLLSAAAEVSAAPPAAAVPSETASTPPASAPLPPAPAAHRSALDPFA